jgi:autotransporter-associated beta strand protein
MNLARRFPFVIGQTKRSLLRDLVIATLLPLCATLCVSQSARLQAATIAQVEANVNTTQTIDQNPVITAILSQPQTGLNGVNFSSWAFLVDDGTGSLDIFGALPSSSGYTPTVGDAITATGKYVLFNAFPEIQSLTAISKVSSGNAVPVPLSETIPQINLNPIPLSIGGHLVTVSNVTISNFQNGDTTFGSANRTATITDSSNNSMTLFYNPGTYSTSNANLFGKTIPTGPVTITGLEQVSGSTKELIPMSIVFPPPPGQVFWNPNGTIGGPGAWNTGDASWNTKSDGTGTSAAFTASNYATFTGAGGTVTIGQAGITANGLEFQSNGYTIQSGTLTLGDTVDAGATPVNTITVTNASDTATINSQISGSSGLAKAGSGTLVLGSTANNFTGNVTISGGTLLISADANLGDTANGIVIKGGTLKLNAPSGDVSLSSTRSLSGTSGTLDVGAGHTLTVNGAVNLTGSLTVPANENIVFAAASGTKTLGGMTVGANSTATVNGDVNFGTTAASFSIASGASVIITGALNTQSVAATAHIVVNGAGTFDLQNADANFIHPFQIGTAGGAGPTMIVHNSNTLGYGPFAPITMFFNSGTITNQSGTPLQFGPNLKDSIGGTGAFPSTFAGADMEFQGSVNLFRPSGTAQNRITINNNTTFSGGWSTDAGTSSNTAGVVFNGSGTLTLSTTSGGDFSKLLVPIAVDTATVNFNGADPNNIASLSVTNNGSLNLGTANAFAGSTTPSAVALSSGGKLGTGGFSQTFGALTVTGSTALDLGKMKTSPPAIVQFADSHSIAWAAGSELSILNWTGSAGTGGGADQVIFGTTNGGLSVTQLGQIHFQGFNGASILASGEVVPQSLSTRKLGDFTLDGHATAADVPAMLTALTDLGGFQSSHLLSTDDMLNIGDINADGKITNADLQGLLNLLKAGGGSGGGTTAVPEPSSILLLALGGLMLTGKRFRRISAKR